MQKKKSYFLKINEIGSCINALENSVTSEIILNKGNGNLKMWFLLGRKDFSSIGRVSFRCLVERYNGKMRKF